VKPRKNAAARRELAKAFDAEIGARIRERRERMDMTQFRLGTLLGYSLAQVSRYESGKTRIDAGTLIKLADVFSCKVSDLTDGIHAK
jgi:transcriptional regulator with XRE-family HTH domain